MLDKKVRSRIVFVILILFSVSLIVYLSQRVLKDNVVYFLSPTEIKNKKEINTEKKIRLGGMVKKGSIKSNNNYIGFIVTDYKNEIYVSYSGALPNLFAEEKGVVAEGILNDKNYFVANKILAKHDENYMPPKITNKFQEK